MIKFYQSQEGVCEGASLVKYLQFTHRCLRNMPIKQNIEFAILETFIVFLVFFVSEVTVILDAPYFKNNDNMQHPFE